MRGPICQSGAPNPSRYPSACAKYCVAVQEDATRQSMKHMRMDALKCIERLRCPARIKIFLLTQLNNNLTFDRSISCFFLYKDLTFTMDILDANRLSCFWCGVQLL